MNHLNYIFFEEYKNLEKLCAEIYHQQHGITCYIDEMKTVSENRYRRIPYWEADLKRLIHIRHIRNHLAHEGDFNEKACTQNDIDWIKAFHERILTRTDPLAVLHQNLKAENNKPKQPYAMESTFEQTGKTTHSSTNRVVKAFYFILLFFILSIILICLWAFSIA